MRNLLLSTFMILAIAGSDLLAAKGPEKFVEEVLPLLEAKCVSCHGPQKQEGNLRLDSFAAAKAGGDRGAAIVAGNVAESLLVQAISFLDPDFQMPPKQKLTAKEIATLTEWITTGAAWPEPVAVLFEDQPQFLAALASGNGKSRLFTEGAFAGKAALGITPLQRDGVRIPGWNFAIREQSASNEHRYLRLAWKKRGVGSVMIELAADGQWPDANVAKGRYVAGPNTTGWAAISVGETVPTEWTVATFDLWQDMGDFTLTGIAPTCDGGEEAFFDSIILGPTIASLDAYRPGAATANDATGSSSLGDALTDKRNPIHKLFHGERLDLWSLKKPQALNTSGVSHSIDDFIRERLAKENLQLAPEADRRTLIRRLTFDLIGLPPTSEESAAFLADQSPDAYNALVQRLLESPHYGERQARLWLDVVRYADTNGYERDEFRPLAWQYRDYVIRSFNYDKPFDQFICEQLAGDELVDGVPKSSTEVDKLIATGYLRLGQWDSTASIFQEEPRLHAEMMADVTNTTASAFLGVTMSCCQCHDHKYDPFSQADHFRFRAFFAGVLPRDDLPISVVEEQAEIDKHNAEINQQTVLLKDEQTKLDDACKERHEELKIQIAEIESKQRKPRLAMGATDGGSIPPATHIFYQGDFLSPREEVAPGFVSVFTPEPAAIQSPRDNTTGRRLALATWMTSADNPWTARVIVNRIWQQHFGTGLVATPNDFGHSGARPTHPEILDALAVQFMQRGWSIKELHRLIVTSTTYRQSSRETPFGRAIDPENKLLWRQSVRRLDAEMLRDSLLAVSGLLKPYDGGKPIWPPVPDELLKAQPAILEAIEGKDDGRQQGWYADPIEQTDVRSVFLVRKRCLPIPFLQVFDLPDTIVSCARRDTTVVAPQALMLLNSLEGVRYAQALAARVCAANDKLEYDDDSKTKQLVEVLFQVTVNRTPTAEELPLLIDFLKRHAQQHKDAGDRAGLLALTDLCRAILNLNEFAYID
ncbi:MAG: PSD1 and planctomycete cytochrome C domain-containing protein [Planctomycetota bacterium]